MNPPAYVPPVTFKFGFTRSAGSDAAAQPRQRQPQANQPAEPVSHLGQFNLQFAFPALRAAGENVQDQHCPVNHPAAAQLLDVPDLGTR
jgi:hypothetical protein